MPFLPNVDFIYHSGLWHFSVIVLFLNYVCQFSSSVVLYLYHWYCLDAVGEYNARKKDATDGNGENPSLDEDKEDSYTVEGSTPGFFAGVFSDQDTGYSERLHY